MLSGLSIKYSCRVCLHTELLFVAMQLSRFGALVLRLIVEFLNISEELILKSISMQLSIFSNANNLSSFTGSLHIAQIKLINACDNLVELSEQKLIRTDVVILNRTCSTNSWQLFVDNGLAGLFGPHAVPQQGLVQLIIFIGALDLGFTNYAQPQVEAFCADKRGWALFCFQPLWNFGQNMP
eukprot:gene7275-14827_t